MTIFSAKGKCQDDFHYTHLCNPFLDSEGGAANVAVFLTLPCGTVGLIDGCPIAHSCPLLTLIQKSGTLWNTAQCRDCTIEGLGCGYDKYWWEW